MILIIIVYNTPLWKVNVTLDLNMINLLKLIIFSYNIILSIISITNYISNKLYYKIDNNKLEMICFRGKKE